MKITLTAEIRYNNVLPIVMKNAKKIREKYVALQGFQWVNKRSIMIVKKEGGLPCKTKSYMSI